MRIQHNIPALNSYRNYNVNAGALNKNLEKLSSGYKINRAGDDAAGLAISEKMRAQITGLETATKNVKDGISLVKTAEGAMQEIHDMLNRMEELATQSANGTSDNNVDRSNLQKEVEALKSEINRIADSSNFNGIKLLDGSLAAEGASGTTQSGTTQSGAAKPGTAGDLVQTVMIDSEKGTVTDVAAKGNKFISGAITTATAVGTIEMSWKDAEGVTQKKTFELKGTEDRADIINMINDDAELSKIFKATTGTAAGTIEVTTLQAGDADDVKTVFSGITKKTGGGAFAVAAGSTKDGINRAVVLSSWDNSTGTATSITNSTQNIKIGDTITIGEKTYEFVADNSAKAKGEGNVAVAIGTTNKDADSLDNLVKALKENGVESAKLVKTGAATDYSGYATAAAASATGIWIDTAEIKVDQQGGLDIKTVAGNDSFMVKNELGKAGEYSFTVNAASASKTRHSVTVNYIDENGEAKEKTLAYEVGDTAAANEVAVDMVKFLTQDEELSKLFDIAVDTTTNTQINFTAKTTGTSGAVLTGIATSDDNGTNGVNNQIKVEEKAQDATVSLEVDWNTIKSGDTIEINGETYTFVTNQVDATTDNAIRYTACTNGTTATVKQNMESLIAALGGNGVKATFDSDTNAIVFTPSKDTVAEKPVVKPEVKPETESTGGLTLQIGDTSDDFNKLNVKIGDMHVNGMVHEVTDEKTGEVTETKALADIDISTQEGAAAAIDVIKSSINYVSSVRGDLGAIQNRLEHTQNNLSVMTENIQDAESSIRDTDVAAEMMIYTKNNILLQSAQAMLAQANQQPQGVLQLLG